MASALPIEIEMKIEKNFLGFLRRHLVSMEHELKDRNIGADSWKWPKSQFGKPLPFPTCVKNTPFCLLRFTASESRE